MGSMKTHYIKEQEQRRHRLHVRVTRQQADKATSKQIDYLIALGEKHGKPPADTLDWVVSTFVSQLCTDMVTCYMDLTKDECSQAIKRLKETQPTH